MNPDFLKIISASKQDREEAPRLGFCQQAIANTDR